MATWNSNGSPSNIQVLHDGASNGDTITIPAGTFTWTTGISFTKGVTLQGQGIGSTIIKDGVSSNPLITWTLAASVLNRITAIEFQDGGRTSTSHNLLDITGSNTNGSQFRWDHCKWINLNGVARLDTLIGVIDHLDITITVVYPPWQIFDSLWNGHTFGDGSWAASVGWGGSDFLFFEDNEFHISGGLPVSDAYEGARFVMRHNQFHDGWVANHGTESSGRDRGCRAVEVYSNLYVGIDTNKFVGTSRSGTILFHNNTVSGFFGGLARFTLENFRMASFHSPWGVANGTNVWDVNDGTTFFTGTTSGANTGTTVPVSGSPGWTTNQWAGYSLHRTTDNGSSGTINGSEISSNTSNSITYKANGFAASMSFVTGDGLEIRKVLQVIDGSGRGGGSLLSGNPPSPPVGWNDQVTDPCYAWANDNLNTGGTVGFTIGDSASVVQNEHFFNNVVKPGYTSYTYPHPLQGGASEEAIAIEGAPIF